MNIREDYLDFTGNWPHWKSRDDRLRDWWESASFGLGLEGKSGRAVGNAEDALRTARRIYDSAQRARVRTLSESGLSVRKVGEAVGISKSKVARMLNDCDTAEPTVDEQDFESAKVQLHTAETAYRLVKHQAVYANLKKGMSPRRIAEGLSLPKTEVWYMAALMSGTSGILSDVSFRTETGVIHGDFIRDLVLTCWEFPDLESAVQDYPRGTREPPVPHYPQNLGGTNG